jgi:hypothetical protein
LIGRDMTSAFGTLQTIKLARFPPLLDYQQTSVSFGVELLGREWPRCGNRGFNELHIKLSFDKLPQN